MDARSRVLCPKYWLRARVRSRGCAMAAVEGTPVEREAGGGLEVRLRCVLRAAGPGAWVPPGSGVEDRSSEAGGRPLFSPSRETLGPWGRRHVVLTLLCPWPSYGSRCALSTALPLPRPLTLPSSHLWYCKLHLLPDSESTLRRKLAQLLAQRRGRSICMLMHKVWFLRSRVTASLGRLD